MVLKFFYKYQAVCFQSTKTMHRELHGAGATAAVTRLHLEPTRARMKKKSADFTISDERRETQLETRRKRPREP